MSSLNLSHALVAGTNENVNDIQDNFDDIVAWSTQIDETNMSSSSGLFSAYRNLRSAQAGIQGGSTASGNYLFSSVKPAGGGVGLVLSGSSGPLADNTPQGLYFDDADYTVSGKTQRLRVRGQAYTNLTAPAVTFVFGLYPISSLGGSGASALTITLGTVVSGSTATITTPSASSKNSAVSSDFAIPADGHYVLGVNISGTNAANSCVAIASQLQTRWV